MLLHVVAWDVNIFLKPFFQDWSIHVLLLGYRTMVKLFEKFIKNAYNYERNEINLLKKE